MMNAESIIDRELSNQFKELDNAFEDLRTAPEPEVTLADTKFRTFRNIIDFITSPEGLAMQSVYTYGRQYQYIRDFYQLICPQCNDPGPNPEMPYDVWGNTPQQMQLDVLFEYNADKIMQCPQCGMLQKEAYPIPKSELIGIAGMRSSKTMMSALMLLYELHCDLLLENPQKTWDIAPGQEVYYSLCTTKGEQAKDTIFAAVDGLFINSPWFTHYNNVLKKRALESHIPLDRVFVKNLSEIRYLHKQLFIDLTGANSAGIAGKTRKVVVMDEIARFVESESRMGVDAVYDTLRASLLTLADHGSKMICISSPWFKGDKIMRLYEEAKENKTPYVLAFHKSTWDFNPHFPREHPFIESRFQEDPTAAKRDYGADPPGAQDPWLADEWRIDDCIDDTIPMLVHHQDYTTSLIVKGKRTDMISKKILFKDVTTTKHIVIAVDPGSRFDSFGMVLAYLKPIRTVRGVEEHMFVGACLAWEPSQQPRKEVDFSNVLNVIKEFAAHWQVDKVIYDQWQSLVHIQDLQATGIDAEKIPLKAEDWDCLAALFYNKQIHMLHEKIGGEAAKRLVWELKNLELKSNGKVDHSVHSSSDLAVCLARAAKILLGPDAGQQRLLESRAQTIGRTLHFSRP